MRREPPPVPVFFSSNYLLCPVCYSMSMSTVNVVRPRNVIFLETTCILCLSYVQHHVSLARGCGHLIPTCRGHGHPLASLPAASSLSPSTSITIASQPNRWLEQIHGVRMLSWSGHGNGLCWLRHCSCASHYTNSDSRSCLRHW